MSVDLFSLHILYGANVNMQSVSTNSVKMLKGETVLTRFLPVTTVAFAISFQQKNANLAC